MNGRIIPGEKSPQNQVWSAGKGHAGKKMRLCKRCDHESNQECDLCGPKAAPRPIHTSRQTSACKQKHPFRHRLRIAEQNPSPLFTSGTTYSRVPQSYHKSLTQVRLGFTLAQRCSPPLGAMTGLPGNEQRTADSGSHGAFPPGNPAMFEGPGSLSRQYLKT